MKSTDNQEDLIYHQLEILGIYFPSVCSLRPKKSISHASSKKLPFFLLYLDQSEHSNIPILHQSSDL